MNGGIPRENRQAMPQQAAADRSDSVDRHVAQAIGSGGVQALEQLVVDAVQAGQQTGKDEKRYPGKTEGKGVADVEGK